MPEDMDSVLRRLREVRKEQCRLRAWAAELEQEARSLLLRLEPFLACPNDPESVAEDQMTWPSCEIARFSEVLEDSKAPFGGRSGTFCA